MMSKGVNMAQITIHDLDDAILVRLKRRAWEQGLPLEESLRRLVLASLEADDGHSDDFSAVLNPTRSYLAGEMSGAVRRVIFHS
jgi:plasmid stability protein